MAGAVSPRPRRGVEAVALGDLFLEDIRRYRERADGRHRSRPRCSSRCGAGDRSWPLEMIDGRLQARLTCAPTLACCRSRAAPFRPQSARERPAARRRSLRRARRVPHLRVGRPMFRAPIHVRSGRGRRPWTASCSPIWLPVTATHRGAEIAENDATMRLVLVAVLLLCSAVLRSRSLPTLPPARDCLR